MIVGVLVALNTVYLRGSIGDYFKVMGAALSTMIGIDLAAAAFNRVADASRTIGGQTITRA